MPVDVVRVPTLISHYDQQAMRYLALWWACMTWSCHEISRIVMSIHGMIMPRDISHCDEHAWHVISRLNKFITTWSSHAPRATSQELGQVTYFYALVKWLTSMPWSSDLLLCLGQVTNCYALVKWLTAMPWSSYLLLCIGQVTYCYALVTSSYLLLCLGQVTYFYALVKWLAAMTWCLLICLVQAGKWGT